MSGKESNSFGFSKNGRHFASSGQWSQPSWCRVPADESLRLPCNLAFWHSADATPRRRRFTGAEASVLPPAPSVWWAAALWPWGGWGAGGSGGSGPGRWSCGVRGPASTLNTGWAERTAGIALGRAAGWYRRHRTPPTLWSWRSLQERRYRYDGYDSDFKVGFLTYKRLCELTDGLERHVSERLAEVAVEEAFEDVEGDVGQAGVDVGIDGQNQSVGADEATRGDVSLMSNKHSKTSPWLIHFILNNNTT